MIDTCNVHHADAFEVFQTHRIYDVVRKKMGMIFWGNRAGGGIYISTHSGGPELAKGLTLRQAFDDFMRQWDEAIDRKRAAP